MEHSVPAVEPLKIEVRVKFGASSHSAKALRNPKVDRPCEIEPSWRSSHFAALRIEDWGAIEDWVTRWDSVSVHCGQCRAHWEEFNTQDPPGLESRIAFFWWSYRAHNAVSQRIGKSVWSCGRFYRKYKEGKLTSRALGE